MATIQKSRSYTHEKEVEEIGDQLGYRRSERAWGSNGEAMGFPKEVDVVWENHDHYPNLMIQSKVRKSYPKWFQALMRRSDREPQHIDGLGLVLMPLGTFLAWLDLTSANVESRLWVNAPDAPLANVYLERDSFPKWLHEEYKGSIFGSEAADVLIFREMRRGLSVAHYVLLPVHTFQDGIQPTPSTSA